MIDFKKLAKNYYEYHGNLKVSQNFKTINGYVYDEAGLNLGTWANTQRRAKRKGILSQDKEEKLIAIGMIFDVRNNKSLIQQLCQNYEIDEKKNKAILKGIAYREMVAKIKYLEERQLPIVTNGYLHEIFNISNQALQEKYGICLGNGKQELKQVSYYVTDNIEKDGIYKALKYFKLI